MKHLRLLPNQIPLHWDLIKYTVMKVAAVESKHRANYLNKLLNDLLCSKAQCFIRVKGTEIMAVLVTRISEDQYRGIRTLFIDSLYSFKPAKEEDWQEVVDIITKYAKLSKCNIVTTYSSIPKVWEICEDTGFKESFRCFTIDC